FPFHDPTPTETYTLSLHDALPISSPHPAPDRLGELEAVGEQQREQQRLPGREGAPYERGRTREVLPAHRQQHAGERRDEALRQRDRKSIRLNSSHVKISYADFCLK